jgi:hypothetical protein
VGDARQRAALVRQHQRIDLDELVKASSWILFSDAFAVLYADTW